MYRIWNSPQPSISLLSFLINDSYLHINQVTANIISFSALKGVSSAPIAASKYLDCKKGLVSSAISNPAIIVLLMVYDTCHFRHRVIGCEEYYESEDGQNVMNSKCVPVAVK